MKEQIQTKDLAYKICKILSDKKAFDITIIDVSNMTIIADYFVLASARSTTAVKMLAGELEEKMEQAGYNCLRKEGLREGRWVAVDYGEIIVHIFHEETRNFYQLERLWTDGANAIVYND